MGSISGLSPLSASASRPWFSATRSGKSSLLLFHGHPSIAGRQRTSAFRSSYFVALSSKSTFIKSNMFSKTSETIDPQSSESTDGDVKYPSEQEKTPFGYTRKDVLLTGLGVTVAGVALKSGLEFLGVDSLQAGNAVQLVVVLGLTVGWISTYIFRVSNKEMTYAQQLRDYENKVMQKRLEGLTEAELEELLAQVEEEKQQIAGSEQIK